MAELKVGEPFGVGSPNFEKLDLDLALERIRNDLKTDFIYAPHLGLIYAKAGKELKEALEHDLKNGAYSMRSKSDRPWRKSTQPILPNF